MTTENHGASSVLVALVHDTLNGGAFASLADLADAVKHAAARRRIPYSGPSVAAAIRSVGARRPLVVSARRVGVAMGVRPAADAFDPPVSHADAAAILGRVHARHAVKPFSPGRGRQ
jgi:hypothetical protein